jgi:hypothetical protein
MVAKTKMSVIEKTSRRSSSGLLGLEGNGHPGAGAEEEEGSPRRSGARGSRGGKSAGAAADEAKWVACDLCGRWRRLPSTVNMDSLPEQWFCEMNIWDPLRNSCQADEESGDTSVSPNPGAGVGVGSREGSREALAHLQTDDDRDHERRKPTSARRGHDDGAEGDVDESGASGAHPLRRSANSIRRGSKGQSRQAGHGEAGGPGAGGVEEKVNWVQCNKCNKWRKVPMSVDVDALPDEWYCSLNTWAPLLAKCSAREESDTTNAGAGAGAGAGPMAVADDAAGAGAGAGGHGHGGPGQGQGHGGPGKEKGPRRGSSNRSRHDSADPVMPPPGAGAGTGVGVGVGAGAGAGAGATGVPQKKVTQWVQCERTNCKKWRKLPAHVDMGTLPEKWFCEMNRWDPDRAYCGGPEETDSEGEQQQAAATHSQLILANSKGPMALSYRRIIFGTDGRIRPQYSEKNRNGYGLFSFSEAQRQPGEGEADEYLEPARRVSYW